MAVVPHLKPVPATQRRPMLLPVTMVAVAALLLVKIVANLPDASGALRTAGQIGLPSARASEPAAAKPPSPPPQARPPPNAAANLAANPAATPPDPGPNEAERALLNDLRARRLVLEDRAKTLDGREALAAAAERRLADRIDQLTTLQNRLEVLEHNRREREDANWRSLVKTYETMRPRDAATIFNDLDQPTLLEVLDRMKEAKAAPVLAAMQPERARVMTAELAKWRSRATATDRP